MLCRIGQVSLMNRPSALARASLRQKPAEKDDRPLTESSPQDLFADLHEERFAPDFSVFSALGSKDVFEPIPMGENRTPCEQAALHLMLEQSVEFLFATSASSSQRNRLFPNQVVSSSLHGSEQKLQTLPDTSESSPVLNFNKKRNREHIPSSADVWSSSTVRGTADDDLNIEKPPAKKARRRISSTEGSSFFRFREYQSAQWDERYDNLMAFREANGHCSVPYAYPQNPALARWVKRQRYQYKLYQDEKPSTMTEQRIQALERIGFVWDAHSAAWEERLSELRKYSEANGDCNVPTTYEINKKLAAWVKCQRRQYKLHMDGKPSTMTEDRIVRLNEMGFHWEVRVFKVER